MHKALLTTMPNNHNNDLLQAAKNGHTEIVLALIQNGAQINARDCHDKTPLHWAA